MRPENGHKRKKAALVGATWVKQKHRLRGLVG